MRTRFLWIALLVFAVVGWLVWRWQRREPAFPQLMSSPAPVAPMTTARIATPPVEQPTAPTVPPTEESYTGYCAHCRTKRPIVDGVVEITANDRHAVRGTCQVCGSKMFSFIASPDSPADA